MVPLATLLIRLVRCVLSGGRAIIIMLPIIAPVVANFRFAIIGGTAVPVALIHLGCPAYYPGERQGGLTDG